MKSTIGFKNPIPVKRVTKEEMILHITQACLQKLRENGYSLYIGNNLTVPLPNTLEDNKFPMTLYNEKTDKKITLATRNDMVNLVKEIDLIEREEGFKRYMREENSELAKE